MNQQTKIFPIIDFSEASLGTTKLPEEFAGLFVEHIRMLRSPNMLGRRGDFRCWCDKNFAVGNGDIAMLCERV